MSFTNKLKTRLQEVLDNYSVTSLIKTVDIDTSNHRMSICNSCEFLFTPTKSCRKCGCFMTSKSKLESAKCPIGKW
jgi:hypothetical protein